MPGRGLEGDRYFDLLDGNVRSQPGRDLTLIEAEAVEGLADYTGIELGLGGRRGNVVTRAVSLNELVGKRFRVGSTECYGQELCHPSRSLERMTENGVLKGLANRGGLRADIVAEGQIALGDEVAELPAALT